MVTHGDVVVHQPSSKISCSPGVEGTERMNIFRDHIILGYSGSFV